MEDALMYDRLQFALTASFHYLFPQLTMGLTLFVFYLKSHALWTGDEHSNQVARFWTKILALNFGFGVVTGIPLEFQFGIPANPARPPRISGNSSETIFFEG